MKTRSDADQSLTPPHAHGPSQRSPALSGLIPALARPRAGRGGGVPGEEERSELARTLGAELKALRAESRMSQVTLARRAGVSAVVVRRLEVGRRRPSMAMLHALAVGCARRLPPSPAVEVSAVLNRLVAATGPSLVVDTPGGIRRRERRLRDAGHAYLREAERWWAGECAAAQRAELAFVEAIRILDRPGALDDCAALEEASRALDVSSSWLAQNRSGPWGTTSVWHKFSRAQERKVRR